MREIKFRAWDNENKRTGLKDRNGKEIYEGDILYNGYGGPYHTRNMIVCWLNYHAEWSLATRRENIGQWAIQMKGQSSGNNSDSNYEIIGNIHENPELLKDGNERS
jgi:uncharacterized phage protein (TIGR01671 family)